MSHLTIDNPIDRRRFAAAGLAGGATLIAATVAQAHEGKAMDESATLAEIAELRRRFADILRRHDHGALAPLVTKDTMVLPAGRPLVRGRDAVVAFWTAATSDPAVRLRSEFDAVDSMFEGDVVIESGRATVFAVEGSTERLFDHGKYIVVWKREDGAWKRHRDIFNSDGPPS